MFLAVLVGYDGGRITVYVAACVCDCVCVSKQKRESERERGRLSQTDLLISHLKAGVCFRMGEIGRWSCQRKKGRHEVERKDKRWLGGMGGSFRD